MIRCRTPFAMVPEWIVFADISSHAVRLWAALHRYDGLPNGAMPSRATLAERMHISLDTLDRAKNELIEIGALTVERRAGTSSEYILEDRPNCRTGAAPTLGTDAAIGAARVRQEREGGKESELKENAPLERVSTPRDEIWNVITDIFGEARTRSARTLRGKVVSSLLEAGATAQEVADAATKWDEKMPPGTTFTETALEKHYGLLLGPMGRSNGNGQSRFGRGMTPEQIKARTKGAA